MNWYKNTTEELLHTLQTTRQGLSSEERNQRLAKQGENKITEAAPYMEESRQAFYRLTDVGLDRRSRLKRDFW